MNPFVDFALLAQTAMGGLDPSAKAMAGEGWKGFADVNFLLVFLGRLLLATVLALLIAYHPKTSRIYKSIEDAELPNICVLYAIVAAIIGSAVLKFGATVGFVVFGIGGLLRFRSTTGSTGQTGRIILVTVIGLCAGLDLPQVAVLSTLFAMVLMWIAGVRATRCLAIKGLPKGDFDAVAAAYRSELEASGCKIVGENANPAKRSHQILFSAPSGLSGDEVKQSVAEKFPDKQIGTVEWES